MEWIMGNMPWGKRHEEIRCERKLRGGNQPCIGEKARGTSHGGKFRKPITLLVQTGVFLLLLISLCLFSSFLPSFLTSFLPSVRPSVLPSVRPSVRPSVPPSVLPSFRPSFCPSVRLSVRPFLHPSVRSSKRPSNRSSVRPSVSRSVSPSVLLSVSMSVSQRASLSASTSVYPSAWQSVRLHGCSLVWVCQLFLLFGGSTSSIATLLLIHLKLNFFS